MAENGPNDDDRLLAVIEHGNERAMLYDNGYWYGGETLAATLNESGCWKHWGPQHGDPAAWAVETACKIVGKPHELVTFFGLEDIGSSVDRDAVEP